MVSPELKAKVQSQEMGPRFQMQGEGCSHLLGMSVTGVAMEQARRGSLQLF